MKSDKTVLSSIEHLRATTSGIAGGPYTDRVEAYLSECMATSEVRLTTSGTDALEMSAILAGVEEGDVVVVPSFGFVTTALAYVRAGARIRFVDIDPTTLGIDPEDLAEKMDASVRAVVPIHYGGFPCDIQQISSVLAPWDRAVLIEDNAHGLFGHSQGRPLGTFGAMSCLSFHATKNVSCGEGGALVLNDRSLVDRADIVLEKGTDRRAFFNGEVDKYTWRDLGSSFGLSDYLAALLLEELRRVDDIQRRRGELTAAYMRLLEGHQTDLGFRVPRIRPGDTPGYHLFYVLLESASLQGELLSLLRSAGVQASFHFPALHDSPAGRRWAANPGSSCPVSQQIAESIVRLPLDSSMTEGDAEKVVDRFLYSLNSLSSER